MYRKNTRHISTTEKVWPSGKRKCFGFREENKYKRHMVGKLSVKTSELKKSKTAQPILRVDTYFTVLRFSVQIINCCAFKNYVNEDPSETILLRLESGGRLNVSIY